MWMGGGGYSLAGSLITLIGQLRVAYPDMEWQTSPQTGTIGDLTHQGEGSASDHNPWLNNTVRAVDIAKTAKGPDCEQLFAMSNSMYGARDARMYPWGYGIFNGRITDWDNPGGYHAQDGDPHLLHWHNSVGRTGYNSTALWPIPGSKPAPAPAPASKDWFDMATAAQLTAIVRAEVRRAAFATMTGAGNAAFTPKDKPIVDNIGLLAHVARSSRTFVRFTDVKVTKTSTPTAVYMVVGQYLLWIDAGDYAKFGSPWVAPLSKTGHTFSKMAIYPGSPDFRKES